MFASIDEGRPIDTGLLVAGHTIMRLAMVAQWLRAAAGDPQRRSICVTYAVCVSIAQVGWIFIGVLPLGVTGTVIGAVVLWIVELSGPIVAERRGTPHGVGMTPWHPHHIAERYSLLAIIALGETVLGAWSGTVEGATRRPGPRGLRATPSG